MKEGALCSRKLKASWHLQSIWWVNSSVCCGRREAERQWKQGLKPWDARALDSQPVSLTLGWEGIPGGAADSSLFWVQVLLVLDIGLVCWARVRAKYRNSVKNGYQGNLFTLFSSSSVWGKSRSALKYSLSFLTFLVLYNPMIYTCLWNLVTLRFTWTNCCLSIEYCSKCFLCDIYLFIH